MAYIFTPDKQDKGVFSFNTLNDQDSPALRNSAFYIADRILNDAKGLLTSTDFSADTDDYYRASLSADSYSVSVSSGFYFFGSGYSNFITPQIIIYDSFGKAIAGSAFSSRATFNLTISSRGWVN